MANKNTESNVGLQQSTHSLPSYLQADNLGPWGTFLNQVNQRSTQQQVEALPTIQKEKSRDTVFIYRSTELKRHIPGVDGQDGIYNITAICGSISPDQNIGFGISEKKFNQDIRNLYPQQDRDNFDSDPFPTVSYAELSPLGKVTTNDKRKSITKEALNFFFENNRIGYAITGAVIAIFCELEFWPLM